MLKYARRLLEYLGMNTSLTSNIWEESLSHKYAKVTTGIESLLNSGRRDKDILRDLTDLHISLMNLAGRAYRFYDFFDADVVRKCTDLLYRSADYLKGTSDEDGALDRPGIFVDLLGSSIRFAEAHKKRYGYLPT